MSKFLYILDNGHGNNTYIKGINAYRKSKVWNDGTRLLEFEFTRNVVKYLSFMLRQENIDCNILVPEQIDIFLTERCRRANVLSTTKSSLLISIHSNYFTDEKVSGFETHYYSEKGKGFAQTFQDQLQILGNNRGLKQSEYYILKHTQMPSILTENGFYSNEKECKKLLTQEFQYQIAEAHFKAIKIIEYTNQELFN